MASLVWISILQIFTANYNMAAVQLCYVLCTLMLTDYVCKLLPIVSTEMYVTYYLSNLLYIFMAAGRSPDAILGRV